jgi:hypothetical protein
MSNISLLRLVIVLTGLARFASCASGIVSLPLEEVHPVGATETAANVRDVAGGEELTVISGPENAWFPRTFTREGKTLLSLPEEWSWCGHSGDYAVMREDGSWWYSRCAGDTARLIVRLVTSESPSQAAAIEVAHPPTSARAWLPIRSKEIEGVLLTTLHESERTLRAGLVTRDGMKELGVLERTDSVVIDPSIWQAHRLDEERIALVSIDFDNRMNSSAVLLRVFAGGEVTESRLRFDGGQHRYVSVASALAPDGSLAVVAASSAAVAAMIVDPDDPTAARPRVLSTDRPERDDLHLTVSGDRFVAGWRYRPDRTIRLAEFNRRLALPAVTVAEEADSLIALRGGAEGVDVYWRTTGGIAHRRLPPQPTGYVVASEAWVWLRGLLQ